MLNLKNYIQTLDHYAQIALKSLEEDRVFRRHTTFSRTRYTVSKANALAYIALMQPFEERIKFLSEKRKHTLRIKYRQTENIITVKLAENAIDMILSFTDTKSLPLNLAFILQDEAETILEMFSVLKAHDLYDKLEFYDPKFLEYLPDLIKELSETQPDIFNEKSHKEAKGPTAWWLDLPTSEGLSIEKDEFERLTLLSRRQRLERGDDAL